jgi:Putative MetA-pathway of phenol degradation
MKYASAFMLFSFLLMAKLFAQDNKLIADRPGHTLTPSATQYKYLQIEAGFYRQSFKLDKYHPQYKDVLYDHPAIVTKYGLIKNLELRQVTVFSTGISTVVNGTFIDNGISLVQLGAKYNFLQQKKIIPQAALIAHYNINTLKRFYKDSVNGGNIILALQHVFSPSVLLGYNFGVEWKNFGYPLHYLYSISPKVNIDEDWIVYAEFFGRTVNQDSPENSLGFGLSYYFNNYCKVDASLGFGLNNNTPNIFYAIGFSYRFSMAQSK